MTQQRDEMTGRFLPRDPGEALLSRMKRASEALDAALVAAITRPRGWRHIVSRGMRMKDAAIKAYRELLGADATEGGDNDTPDG